MDVVLQSVRKLGGTIEIETSPGLGTAFVIQLPLTLAILQVLLARVGELTYALPLHAVRETLRLAPDAVKLMQGREVVFIRNVARPVRRLHELLGRPAGNGHHGPQAAIVVNRAGADEVVVVDDLVGKQQIVIKPLSAYLGAVKGVEGAGILPDGSVTLILNLDEVGP
jgi:two-component system chemotaxis sensor kinase CheA